jgi:hypothetical protein
MDLDANLVLKELFVHSDRKAINYTLVLIQVESLKASSLQNLSTMKL